ncbi:hydrogenase maturation protease [Frankia sp. CiP1_Cm_nod2]|uniref:hydrogenase maturation protease n=1 Tax=Frankia sp. CiP1_Cm_nod2 TaxID=2897161 RepID=UPI00404468E8
MVGCGNILRRDDGVGPVLIRHLWERGVPDGVRVVDGGTAGMDVAFRIREARRVVIVDAARTGARPGTIYRVPGPELADLPPLAGLHTHAFRWDHALVLATWLDEHGPDGHGPGGRGPGGRGPEERGPEERGPEECRPGGRGPEECRLDGRGPDGQAPGSPAGRPGEVTVFLVEAERVDVGWELSEVVRRAMWEVIGLIERDFLAGFRRPGAAATRPEPYRPAAHGHGNGHENGHGHGHGEGGQAAGAHPGPAA